MQQGWVELSNAKKWHYFRDGRSLCGKWMYLGGRYDDTNHDSPDNCAACRKKKAKELEATAATPAAVLAGLPSSADEATNHLA